MPISGEAPNPADKFKDTVTGANPGQPPTLPNTAGGPNKPPPAEPHTTQVGPRPTTPEEWQNPLRIIQTIAALYIASPEEAASVHQFALEKLEKIRQGK